jgi:hypothetical protein
MFIQTIRFSSSSAGLPATDRCDHDGEGGDDRDYDQELDKGETPSRGGRMHGFII